MDGGGWSPKNWPIQPTSRELGANRGTPVDQYYIEKFLEKVSTDIQGCVLEIGDNAYAVRYGGSRVETSEVLSVNEGNLLSKVIADFTHLDQYSANQFDCIILPQTMQVIYNLNSALHALQRVLKPGGVLLVTFPGITRSSISEQAGSGYWGLTSSSAKRLFGEVFQPSNVVVEAYGNVLAASASLYGFSAQDLRQEDLEYRDPQYDVLITIRAQKEQAAEAQNPDSILSMQTHTSAGLVGDRALILLYHRISPPESDPWSIDVTPEHFESHLQAIREIGTPLALDDLIDRLSAGTLPHNAVAVTFDDGYAATLSQARPLLERYAVPATFFIPSAALSGVREYWWDELERIFLQPGTLPPTLEMSINRRDYHWNLGEACVYTREMLEQYLDWRAGEPAPGARQRIYAELWELLHPLGLLQINEVLDKLFAWSGIDSTPRQTHRALTWSEAAGLREDPWIKFGSHSATHVSLGSQPVEAQARELRESKTALEAVTGQIITSLAYPYGNPQDYSIVTAALAREVGYKMAFINSPGVVDRNVDLFYLPRCYVEDWNKEEFARRLVQWMEE